VAGHAVTAVKRSSGIAGDDDVEIGLAERAHRLGLRAHDELGAQGREDLVLAVQGCEFNDGGQCHRLRGAQAVAHQGEQPVH
jgi:hypothetical protein